MKEELEQLLNQLQNQNQQLQATLVQKQNMFIQDKEIEKVLKELETCSDEIYKSVGPILVKTNKNDIKSELKESKEEININLKTIEKQEKRLKDRIREGQEKFQSMIPKQGHGG